jgi:hypothetical protein
MMVLLLLLWGVVRTRKLGLVDDLVSVGFQIKGISTFLATLSSD